MRELRALVPRLPGNLLDTLAVTTVGLLCLVVAGVGVVAITAELVNTWNYYFVMERAIAVATPVATALAGLTVLTGVAAVVVASRER